MTSFCLKWQKQVFKLNKAFQKNWKADKNHEILHYLRSLAIKSYKNSIREVDMLWKKIIGIPL